MRVVAEQGDSIDALCYRHLGSSDSVEATLEANPGLASLGAVLPMGTVVDLPDSSDGTGVSRTQNTLQLWD